MPVKYNGILKRVFGIYTRCQQIELNPRPIPSWRPWSCIFRNWSRLGLKMYIFLTLVFCKGRPNILVVRHQALESTVVQKQHLVQLNLLISFTFHAVFLSLTSYNMHV